MHVLLALILNASLKAKIDADVTRYLQAANTPGATIAVVEDGTVVYSRGYGDRDVQLDASVATYLPNVPHAKEITLRQLLTHTSGLPDYSL